jgi:hypothetical protein
LPSTRTVALSSSRWGSADFSLPKRHAEPSGQTYVLSPYWIASSSISPSTTLLHTHSCPSHAQAADTAELIEKLEDSQMTLGSMATNRYSAPFREEVQVGASLLCLSINSSYSPSSAHGILHAGSWLQERQTQEHFLCSLNAEP